MNPTTALQAAGKLPSRPLFFVHGASSALPPGMAPAASFLILFTAHSNGGHP